MTALIQSNPAEVMGGIALLIVIFATAVVHFD